MIKLLKYHLNQVPARDLEDEVKTIEHGLDVYATQTCIICGGFGHNDAQCPSIVMLKARMGTNFVARGFISEAI